MTNTVHRSETMVVDTSAIIAILLGEADALVFATAIDQAALPKISVVSIVEASIVLRGRKTPEAEGLLDRLLSDGGLQATDVDEVQSRIARRAHHVYGKGSGHPAQLNFGDCFSYALAKATDAPLLYKGDDFSHTDIRSWL